MAAYTYWVRTANASAAAIAANGGSAVTAGGGTGTENDPFGTWAQFRAKLLEVVNHSADTVTFNFHPACIFGAGSSSNWDVWNDVGTGTGAGSWSSTVFQRDESVVASNSNWSTWFPATDTLRFSSSTSEWTQGYISGGSWVAGSGDVYKKTAVVAAGSTTSSAAFPIRCWYGHEYGENTCASYTAGVWCYTLDDLAAAGDYCAIYNGSTGYDIYVKTGLAGLNPITKWGSWAAHTYGGNGTSSVFMQNCRNITWKRFRTIGGPFYSNPQAAASLNTNINFYEISSRMHNSKGLVLQNEGGVASFITNHTITRPDIDSCSSTTTEDRGNAAHEISTQDGIAILGNVDGVRIISPKVSNFSHAQIGASATDARVITSLTQSGGVATAVTSGAHGKTTGDVVYVDGASETGYNGAVTLLSGSGTSFTYAVDASLPSPAAAEDANSTMQMSLNTAGINRYPRNIEIYVESSDDLDAGYGVLSCSGKGYQRGFNLLVPVNCTMSGLTVSGQTVQSQWGGVVLLRSIKWDSTCIQWGDGFGNGGFGYHMGAMLAGQGGPFSARFNLAASNCRSYGHTFDNENAEYAAYTNQFRSTDYTFIGGIVRDNGQARGIPQSNLASSTYTRRVAPFLCTRSTSAAAAYMTIKYNLCALTGCEGLASAKLAVSPSQNATQSTHPIVAVDAVAAWSGQIDGNTEVSVPNAEFDGDLTFVGARKTPDQSGPRMAWYR